MANKYYQNSRSFTPGSNADGNAVDDKFDAVTAGFDQVDPDIQRAIKLPVGTVGDQVITQNAAGRVDKAVGFDQNGDLTLHPNAGTSATNAANSAAAAATSETNAATSASNAATSETNAANSATAASTSASNAAASEANAAASAAAASNSQTAAATSASNAATSESNAAASATAAANSQTAAANSAANAATSEGNAATSASNAATSASNAAASETNAANSATAAATSEANAAASEAAMDLGAIAATLVANAVDWVIYDTSKDSDGGAWRKRCQHLSWYNEPLNTATRGATKEFPAKALIVAEANKVTIYDLTDSSVPMWMVFNAATNNMIYATNVTSIAAVNGILCVGGSAVGDHISVVHFLKDIGRLHASSGTWKNLGDVSQRNGLLGIYKVSADTIINSQVNDVAITVLPDAPIDSATGLQIPTIYAFTGGGISQIGYDGVWSHWTTAETPDVRAGVVMDGYYAFRTAANPTRWWASRLPLTADVTSAYFYQSSRFSYSSFPNQTASQSHQHIAAKKGNQVVYAGTAGVLYRVLNDVTPASSLGAVITSTYNTGYMVGDIRRCFLANSMTLDRSVKGGTLTVVGNPIETVNPNGRNVYSGFTTTDYFQEASHPDWNNIGTGDFSILMSGVKWGTPNTGRELLTIGDGVSVGSLYLELWTPNKPQLYVYTSSGWTLQVASAVAFTDSAEHTFEVQRKAGTYKMIVDGVVVGTNTPALASISNTTGYLRIGASQSLSTNPWTGGQVACIRISATAPTAEQSKFVAEQENKLNGGATCLLSADAVTRLDYDEDSETLVVQTASAYDYMHGLEVFQRGVALTDTSDLGFDRVQINGTTDVRVATHRERFAKSWTPRVSASISVRCSR